ncbi:MAG: hypothetical protein LBR26_03705 [Prevotella sp.]|jgi:uncharacterized protein (TIGR02145 family)|nr:hypothetical protein [Prevotella sp.]
MKKAILSMVIVVAGLLSGCSSEESVSRPETIGQTGTLTFSFPVPRRSVTYTIAGETTGETAVEATEDEIRINDVTVYMFQNSDDGKLVARKTASADEVGARKVTFDVNKFAATGNGNYIFYAVANVNGNITDGFVVGSTTLNDFTSAVATTGTSPVSGSNMLMVGYTVIDALSAQTDPVQQVNLRHRVARFDIDNLTADSDPANNNLVPGQEGYNANETFFEITRIHVLNTKPSGYLTAETNGQARVPVSGRVSFKGANAIDVSGIPGMNGGAVEGAFYLWPGVLADRDHYLEADSTAIEIEGVYSGDGKAELFTVYLDTERRIEANKRYTLKVQRISQTALTFELTASDWGEGNAATAIPVVGDGSLAYGDFKLLVGGATESVQVNDIVDLSDNKGDSDNELRFHTEGDAKATGALTATLDLTLGAGYAVNDVTPVPEGDPVVTYSIGKVRQYYKIILPKTTYPIEGTLTIEDESTQQKKEFAVTSLPDYEDTGFKPVLVGGKYWAPVNVGASSTTYSEGLAGCGYYFQWGRSYAKFTYDSTNSGTDLLSGPLSAGDAETNADKFITNSSVATFYDWLSPQNDGLWTTVDPRGPCPAGWRVPTETELLVLKTKYVSTNFDVEGDKRLRIPGDVNGEFLYLPANGGRDTAGEWNSQSTVGRYWSSSVDGNGARRLYFRSNSSSIDTYTRAYGYSVRCLQE